MVNSGSSANLLALSVLTNPSLPNRLVPGDEVITPAVTWATTVYPIVNCGLVPVLVDVDMETFNILPGEIEEAITPRTKAIMPVHLLGNPCDMDSLMEIAHKYQLRIIEDTCEAHGAEWNGKKVGSFGDFATFSFFFTHHISTIEGGMLVTNDSDLADMAKSLRAFGWIRELDKKADIAGLYPDIDPRYLFVNLGFNLRPTEIQGAFGIHQLPKLDSYIEVRRQNATYWNRILSESPYIKLHNEAPNTRHVWFGYPVIVQSDAPFSRHKIMEHLGTKGVETRPIMAGNIDEQPATKLFEYRKHGDLPNSRFIHRNAFFLGNHQGVGEFERELIAESIQDLLA